MTGRPRDANRDVAILDAALLLLTEVGYDQLSMESIAGRAGVAKTTIYRRYPDKAALVAAAVDHRSGETPPEPGRGGLRSNLVTLVRWLARQIAEQEIGLLGALFAGMRSDPRLAAEMRRILRRDEAAMTDQPLRKAIERGEDLAPHAAGLFAEVAPAVIVHRIVVAGEPCDERFVEHLVDDILLPLLRKPGPKGKRS
ncbi:TetR/AcrR family transcriptional regulator [Amycolatopsis sp.]|uniref:TetR/AcrR family transcriptional regulator n=1 Tax=Amycolatopsis sp. TaxID=37632 RepID=UPI002BA40CDD|nr:TetR/AcrR family transcriptional regulator [Amycolatopsis sp.]HVV11289.1 TetR/AcrR family transcriptional regulator [Amycolatopsis sp.]